MTPFLLLTYPSFQFDLWTEIPEKHRESNVKVQYGMSIFHGQSLWIGNTHRVRSTNTRGSGSRIFYTNIISGFPRWETEERSDLRENIKSSNVFDINPCLKSLKRRHVFVSWSFINRESLWLFSTQEFNNDSWLGKVVPSFCITRYYTEYSDFQKILYLTLLFSYENLYTNIN